MASADESEPITGWGRPSLGDDLRLRLIYFGATVIDESWSHRHESEPFWRIYRNARDGAVVTCAGQRHALGQGEVWLIPPWLSWRSSCQGRFGHVNAHLEIPQWQRDLVRAAFPRPLCIPDDRLGVNLRALAGDLADGGPSAAVFWRVLALCAEVFVHACQMVPVRLRARLLPGDEPLSDLRARIENGLDQTLDNRGLAAAISVSQPTLVRRFRASLGTTPSRYVAARRLARAAELLAVSDLSIDAIATRCGFADRRAFGKAFRRVMGRPPARYRREARG